MHPDLFKLPFEEAIALLRDRLNIPEPVWQQIENELHLVAFGIAGVTNQAMLAELRAVVDDFVANGTSFEDYQRQFRDIAQRHGWQPKDGVSRRAAIVADANLRTMHAAGRYRQMMDPEMVEARPYWVWRHRDSPRPRPHHAMQDGRVFEAADVMDLPIALPSGFGCRCQWQSQRKLPKGKSKPDAVPSDRVSVTGKDGTTRSVPAVWVEDRKGNAKLMPLSDPGWNRSPRQLSDPATHRALLDRMAALIPKE